MLRRQLPLDRMTDLILGLALAVVFIGVIEIGQRVFNP